MGVVTPVEMSAFFHESEVFVLPSLNSTESFGMVQVEAMACGTPVIASNLPGMRVPVLETGCGLLVPPANPGELAKPLIAILDEPGRYRGQPEKLVSLFHTREPWPRNMKSCSSWSRIANSCKIHWQPGRQSERPTL